MHYLDLILSDGKTPDYGKACESMGYCLFALEDFQRALEYFQKSLEYADYDAYKYEIFYYIAQCYDALKNPEKAQEYRQKYFTENWDKAKSAKFAENLTEYQNPQQQENIEDPNSIESN